MTPLLEIDDLVKRFGGLTATDHARFDVRHGEVHALIGPNGAGKTTLIHQISGALAPDAGCLLIHSPFPSRSRSASGSPSCGPSGRFGASSHQSSRTAFDSGLSG